MINAIDPKDKWLLKRFGKFTASVIHKLLLTGKDGKGFSSGGWSYIEERAVETMTVMYERPELEFVEALIHGKAYEEAAYNEYVRVSGNYNMRYFGSEDPVYLEHNAYSGGSPDGLMGEGEVIHLGLELKCPKNSNNHYKYLKFKDQWDLKEQRKEYYAQIQFLMMITGAPQWDFGSFDERFVNPKLRLKIIPVFPDKKFQDNLEVRIAMAQKYKLEIIEQIQNA